MANRHGSDADALVQQPSHVASSDKEGPIAVLTDLPNIVCGLSEQDKISCPGVPWLKGALPLRKQPLWPVPNPVFAAPSLHRGREGAQGR